MENEMNGEIQFLGIVQDREFQQLAPEPDPGGPVRFTSVHVQEARSPESGELNLSEYEGSAIVIRGHRGGGGWVYSAEVVDKASPILTMMVRQALVKTAPPTHRTPEIERKFRVCGNDWRQGEGDHLSQGYLNLDKERTVRVRVEGAKAYLTVKGITTGASRAEFEYEIPVVDAEQLLKLCAGAIIEKTRRAVTYHGFTWQIDEFLGENKGLVVAEIELKSEDQVFDKPSWLGKEVTRKPEYFNANLVQKPYAVWSPEEQ
jgi:adenylate cyclase